MSKLSHLSAATADPLCIRPDVLLKPLHAIKRLGARVPVTEAPDNTLAIAHYSHLSIGKGDCNDLATIPRMLTTFRRIVKRLVARTANKGGHGKKVEKMRQCGSGGRRSRGGTLPQHLPQHKPFLGDHINLSADDINLISDDHNKSCDKISRSDHV